MVIILIAVLVLLSFALYTYAPHRPAIPQRVSQASELDEYFTQLAASGSPPGISVLVVKNDRIVYECSFGHADRPRKIAASSDTVYHWWSMTKIPTTVAILQLQEQGKLSLDDEVRKHLSWFEVNYLSSDNPAITIRHLLQHTSGLPDTMPSMMGWVHYDHVLVDQTELTKRHLPKFSKLKFVPGEKAVYSNLNFMVLGAVIEAVSGQAYEAYVIEHILKPLSMSHTDFLYTQAMSGNEAAGSIPAVHLFTPLLPFLLDAKRLIRQREGKLLWLNPVYVDATPPTGLIGPAGDVGRFMRMVLNQGCLDGTAILSPASVALLTDSAPIDGRGLGWYVDETDGIRYLEHGGGGPGFATIMRIYPEIGLGLVILTNGTDLNRSALGDLLARMNW